MLQWDSSHFLPHNLFLQSILSVLVFCWVAALVLQRRRDLADRRQVVQLLEAEARRYIRMQLQQGAYAVSKADVEYYAKTNVLEQKLPHATPAGLSSPATPAAKRRHIQTEWASVQRRLDLDPGFRASTVSSHLGTEAAWAKADRVYR